MNNIDDQRGGEHDEIYMNKDSIKTLKFIRPAGNVILPSQNSYFLEDPDQLEYEEAPLELQITEDETYSRADIRDYDSPEIRKIKKVRQVNNRAKFDEVDIERGDTMNNQGEVEHDESNYTSYDE